MKTAIFLSYKGLGSNLLHLSYCHQISKKFGPITWFANAAMHLGMADMTILRYAKKWQYGFFSAFGMYLGHFVAWIASGILVALAMQQGGK